MRKHWFALVTTIALLLVARPSSAQTVSWTAPEQLSVTGRFAWFPDIVADDSGRVHVVWSSGVPLWDQVVYTTRADSSSLLQSWLPPLDIAVAPANPGESAATRPSLLVDRQGMLHLTYMDYTNVFYTTAFQAWAMQPQAWSKPRWLNTEGGVYFTRLAADSRGNLHFIYTQNVPSPECRICFHVFHRLSSDGGASWSSVMDLSVTQSGAAKPQIIVDRNDNLHVVWESGPSGGTLGGVRSPTTARYAASYDGGKTWTTPLSFQADSLEEQSKSPAIAQDARGNLIIVWRSSPSEFVYFSVLRDSGRTWSSPQRIPNVYASGRIYAAGLDSYSLATDGGGDVHFVFSGILEQNPQALNVIHMVWDGASWSEPMPIVSYDSGDVPEWPRIAVGLGNRLHAVWFTRNREDIFGSESATADYRVWYASAFSKAMAVRPRSYPTPTPAPTPTIQTLGLQPTRIPPVVSSDPPTVTAASLRTEMDEVGIILLSVLPIAGLVALIALLGKRRRS